MPAIPQTPTDRIDDLKALGLTVEKLPSYKRDERRVSCSKCGCTLADFGGLKFLGPQSFKETVATTGDGRKVKHRISDKVSLTDVTYPGPYGGTTYGHDVWLAARVHALACRDARETDVERRGYEHRRDAVAAVHSLRVKLSKAPEMQGVVMIELALLCDSLGLGAAGDALHSAASVQPPGPRDHAADLADETKKRERLSKLNADMSAMLFGGGKR